MPNTEATKFQANETNDERDLRAEKSDKPRFPSKKLKGVDKPQVIKRRGDGWCWR
jgi:hypothetical protein